MCGIFGYSGVGSGRLSLLKKMADQQVHRGPDDEGFYISGSVGFGVRRLNIIDLETGHQPISNEDRSIWVVCNGEIYNYRELTLFLQQKGHRFYTKSDVECIVHLYEEFGIDCLKHLNGMFGLALYDENRKCLFIARDRLGIKPLYYAALPNCFFFASELRSVLATHQVPRNLDWNSISLFLNLMYIPTPHTPFEEISKLKPGCYLKLNSDGTKVETSYWNLNDPPSTSMPGSEEEGVELLTDLLKQSCDLQLRADVPVCAFLSGGIDSSAVVAFASMKSSRPLRTFHIHFEGTGEKIDERRYARSVAERYGTIHTEVSVDRRDFVRLIPMLIWHLEEPFGDLATVPTYIISEMARKEATVCLNGSGGDALFAGYTHHFYPSMKQKFKSMMGKTGLGKARRWIIGRRQYESRWSALFPDYLEDAERTFVQREEESFPGDTLSKVLARDIDGYLQSNVLFLLDKITMAASLEGRVPLLDHKFVEVAAHLKSSWKLYRGERKHIFKKLLEPYLPYDVLHRGKEGFGAPLDDWLKEGGRTILIRIVENGMLKRDALIINGKGSFLNFDSWDLWKVACLELWYRIIVDSSECPKGLTLEDFV